jgi:peroxiredoxin
MGLWTKRLEVAVNIALLAAFFMVAALAGQRFLSARTDSRAPGPQIGTKVSLSGADWSKADRSLVLVLSTTCHFCTDSAAFYKKLVPDAEGQGLQVIAVLPQSVVDSQAYLSGLGVQVRHIIQASLDSVGASATPTVFIVDRNGVVSKLWVGKLEPQREGQVIGSVQ